MAFFETNLICNKWMKLFARFLAKKAMIFNIIEIASIKKRSQGIYSNCMSKYKSTGVTEKPIQTKTLIKCKKHLVRQNDK